MVYGPKDFCLEISPLDQGSTFLNNNNKLTQNWGMDRNLRLLIFSVVFIIIYYVKIIEVSFLHFNNTVRRQNNTKHS